MIVNVARVGVHHAAAVLGCRLTRCLPPLSALCPAGRRLTVGG
ncbi:hypothetical protein ACN27F_20330 [Solwaraspora sp. WMMB335]